MPRICARGDSLFNLFNPEFTVAIYYGLQILAATLVYCFYHPVLLTGPQRETIGTFVAYLRHDFAPQHNHDYACVAPAECLEAMPKGMQ
jgi:hypothetical protein